MNISYFGILSVVFGGEISGLGDFIVVDVFLVVLT